MNICIYINSIDSSKLIKRNKSTLKGKYEIIKKAQKKNSTWSSSNSIARKIEFKEPTINKNM